MVFLERTRRAGRAAWLLLLVMVLAGGCAAVGGNDGGMEEAEPGPESQPFPAIDFEDILVPPELQWNREGSMSIRTESFAGGTLKYTGKVEVNSLTEFFINTMTRQDWKLVGSVKYRNVLLAFTKPHKTCTISIFETGFSQKTEVYIYITDDIAARRGTVMPFGGGNTR